MPCPHPRGVVATWSDPVTKVSEMGVAIALQLHLSYLDKSTCSARSSRNTVVPFSPLANKKFHEDTTRKQVATEQYITTSQSSTISGSWYKLRPALSWNVMRPFKLSSHAAHVSLWSTTHN